MKSSTPFISIACVRRFQFIDVANSHAGAFKSVNSVAVENETFDKVISLTMEKLFNFQAD